jgi:hypothetical protein
MTDINGKPFTDFDVSNMSREQLYDFETLIWNSLDAQFPDIPKNARLSDYLSPVESELLTSLHDKWVLHDKQQRAAMDLATPLVVDGAVYNKISAFPVLWQGWESDGQAWVVEKDGQRYIGTTNHGEAVLASAEWLEDKIAEYARVLDASKEALAIVSETFSSEPPRGP